MEIVDLGLERLRPAAWNSNTMTPQALRKLKASIQAFSVVGNLVVRPLADGSYEVISGNQRLKALADLGYTQAPCLVVSLNDGRARLLAEALNHLHGSPDLGLRAEVVRNVLKALPEEEALAVLLDSAEGLRGLAALGQQDMGEYLAAWEKAQGTRLKHLQFQLSGEQLDIVSEALERALATGTQDASNPNRRGTALAAICRAYLQGLGAAS